LFCPACGAALPIHAAQAGRPPAPVISGSVGTFLFPPAVAAARGAAVQPGRTGTVPMPAAPPPRPTVPPIFGGATPSGAGAAASTPVIPPSAAAAPPQGSPARRDALTAASIAIPAAADARTALLGLVVDGFAIDSVLGAGGCGTVYRGRQLGLDRPVAIKVPTFDVVDDPVLKKRFVREARAAARVRHPGVVTIYGVGELPDGRPFLAMELLDGVSLAEALDHGPLPVERALALARQIALALAETHAAGVVHRDLKPSNIIWRTDRGGEDHITIVDFGIAAGQQGSADATRLTSGGKVIGTPHYMAPEQAQGEHQDIDHRTDLYALGCVLFELITAEVPFDGSGFEVLLAHMARPAPLPSERLPGIPPDVDELVASLLRKRPEQRLGSAEEVVAKIDELLRRGGADRTAPALAAAAATETSLSVSDDGDALDDRRPDGDGAGDGAGARQPGVASTLLAAARPVRPTAMTPPATALPTTSSRLGSGARPGAELRDERRLVSEPRRDPARPPRHDDASRTHRAEAGSQLRAPMRGRRAGLIWIAVAALAAAALIGAAVELRRRPRAAVAQPAPAPQPSPPPPAPAPAPAGDTVRDIMMDSNGLSMRVRVPATLTVGHRATIDLQLWNPDGKALNADKVVITIEEPNGAAMGFAAKQVGHGMYAFSQEFADTGRHVVRVFPPVGDATFELDLDVVPDTRR
jgi:Protein kinase domain